MSLSSLAISWFAAGCYYYLRRQWADARHFFLRSTQLKQRFAPGWIAYGHSISALGEVENALAAYRSAHRLFPQSPIPPLCIASEYLAAKDPSMASPFLLVSQKLLQQDPHVLHEIGVMHFQAGRFQQAVNAFFQALDLWNSQQRYPSPSASGTLSLSSAPPAAMSHMFKFSGTEQSSISLLCSILSNLGHCQRKLGDLDSSRRFFDQAHVLAPSSAPIVAALGFTVHLSGDLDLAVTCYHKALALDSEMTLVTSLLNDAMLLLYS